MALDPYYSLENVKEFGTKRPKGIRTRRRARKTYEYIYPTYAHTGSKARFLGGFLGIAIPVSVAAVIIKKYYLNK